MSSLSERDSRLYVEDILTVELPALRPLLLELLARMPPRDTGGR